MLQQRGDFALKSRNALSVKLKVKSSDASAMTVHWGDGLTSALSSDVEVSHTYSAPNYAPVRVQMANLSALPTEITTEGNLGGDPAAVPTSVTKFHAKLNDNSKVGSKVWLPPNLANIKETSGSIPAADVDKLLAVLAAGSTSSGSLLLADESTHSEAAEKDLRTLVGRSWTFESPEVMARLLTDSRVSIHNQVSYARDAKRLGTDRPLEPYRCIDFGGTDHFEGAITTEPTYPFTISCWLNKDAVAAGDKAVMAVGDDSLATVHQTILINNTQVFIHRRDATNNQSLAASNITVTATTWHHVCVEFTSSTSCRVWWNGTLADTLTHSATLTTGIDKLVAGASQPNTPADFFDGKLFDVRYFDRAMATDEPARLAAMRYGYPDAGPADANLHYKCDDAAGKTIANSGADGVSGDAALTTADPTANHDTTTNDRYCWENEVGYGLLDEPATFESANDTPVASWTKDLVTLVDSIEDPFGGTTAFRLQNSDVTNANHRASLSGDTTWQDSPDDHLVMYYRTSPSTDWGITFTSGEFISGDESGINSIAASLALVEDKYVGGGYRRASFNWPQSERGTGVFQVAVGTAGNPASSFTPPNTTDFLDFVIRSSPDPVGKKTPRNEANQRNDLEGTPLRFEGQAPHSAELLSPVPTLDGTSEYAQASGKITTGSTSNLTVRARVYSTGGGLRAAAAEYHEGTPKRSWLLGHTTNGQAVFYAGADASPDIATGRTHITNTSRWFHLVGTFDLVAQEVRIYVDGVLEGVTARTSAIGDGSTDTPFMIGAINNTGAPSHHWKGRIADVRVDERTWTPQEVLDDYQRKPVAETNMIADVPCCEGWGDTLNDRSASKNYLTITTSAEATVWANKQNTSDSLVSRGSSGATRYIQANSQWMDKAARLTTGAVAALSVAAWIKPASTGDMVICSEDSASRGWELKIDGNKLRFNTSADGTLLKEIETQASVNAGKWTHVAATIISDVVKLYIDGLPVSMTTVTANTVATINDQAGNHFEIGSRNGGSENFDGLISELVVTSLGLLDTNIWNIFNGLIPPAVSSTIGAWRFRDGGAEEFNVGIAALTKNGTPNPDTGLVPGGALPVSVPAGQLRPGQQLELKGPASVLSTLTSTTYSQADDDQDNQLLVKSTADGDTKMSLYEQPVVNADILAGLLARDH